MRTNAIRLLPCIALLCSCAAFAETIDINVIPTLAPNAYDGASTSFQDWTINALNALETGTSSAGTPGTPSYYQAASGTLQAIQTIATGFPSWMGQIAPTSPFDLEAGNRLTFGVAITTSDPTPSISLSEVGFVASSNDAPAVLGVPEGVLGFGGIAEGYGPGDQPLVDGIGYDWSNGWVGVIYGGNPDGSNEYITSGPTTVLVNALYGIGSGNSEAAYCDPSSSCTLADQQAALDAAETAMSAVTQFTGTYYLSDNSDGSDPLATGSGTFQITTPEPATPLLLLSGIFVIAFVRRRVV